MQGVGSGVNASSLPEKEDISMAWRRQERFKMGEDLTQALESAEDFWVGGCRGRGRQYS